jgi:hypothetical protein
LGITLINFSTVIVIIINFSTGLRKYYYSATQPPQHIANRQPRVGQAAAEPGYHGETPERFVCGRDFQGFGIAFRITLRIIINDMGS